MTEFIPSSRGEGYREVRTPPEQERAFVTPHHILDEGMRRIVYPAIGLTLGHLHDFQTGGFMPALRMDHHGGPTSLVFIPTAEELRAFGQSMLETADQMEQDAADLLASTLAKKGPAA